MVSLAGMVAILVSSEGGEVRPVQAATPSARGHPRGHVGDTLTDDGDVLKVLSDQGIVVVMAGRGLVLSVYFEDKSAIEAVSVGQRVRLSGIIRQIEGPRLLVLEGRSVADQGP